MNKRVFLIVIDGFGVGASPDAYLFNDEGSNTFLNIEKQRKLNIPNFETLGLKNIDGLNLTTSQKVEGIYARLEEKSKGKDTTTGHFEMMKIITNNPAPTFPNGFPSEIIEKLENAWGTKILGNCVASGTKIIEELGEEHIKTKYPIVYTSADSVLQIATHTSVYSLDELYKMCESARNIMQGKYAVSRVIARPFKTVDGKFTRISTARKDFALSPDKPNTLDTLMRNNIETIGVGKIGDIFNNEGLTKSYPSHTNSDAIKDLLTISKQDFNGLCFVNLVDTDMLYGHRNDVEGYAKCLEQLDSVVPTLKENLNDGDYLIFTGDHGNDPTTPSTDHSREYTPLLIYYKGLKDSVNLGTLKGFDNIGKFIENVFGLNIDNSIVFDKINKRK